jgi:predicted  nucleic acid-binding Zn-ribbon protein
MQTSEFTAMQRRVETMEDDLRFALVRLSKMEAQLAEEDRKVKRLEQEVQHDHLVLDRMEHGIPVGL